MFYHKLWLLKFEISTFKNIGNWLHAHGNRLLPCKLVWKECWLLVIDYQRVKLLVKDFSLKNSLEQNCVIQSFLLKKSFYTYLMLILKFLHILSLLLNLHLNLDSWFESWLFTWLLILDWTTLWFLILAWLLILYLSLWHHQNKLGKHCFHKFKWLEIVF